MFDDQKAFQHTIIKILDTLLTKGPNTTQRYLLDTTAKEWGRLVYTTVILVNHFFPTALTILTHALVEARSSETDSYLRSVDRKVREKETVQWFVDAVFFPVLERSSGKQTYIDGRQFTNSEEETFPKNLRLELSEFRLKSDIAEAITATQGKYYDCYQDRAEAIREKLGIKKPTMGLSLTI